MALWMVMSLGLSTTLVHAEISELLFGGFPLNFVQTLRVNQLINQSSVTSRSNFSRIQLKYLSIYLMDWHILYSHGSQMNPNDSHFHHDVDICSFE